MYRRYMPSHPPENTSAPSNGGGKPAGYSKEPRNNYPQQNRPAKNRSSAYCPPRRPQAAIPVREHRENRQGGHRGKSPRSMLFGLLPPSLYNPKTKKLFGFLNSEDLLLVALIFLFLEREDEDETVILALLYILLSDYIDFPFDI